MFIFQLVLALVLAISQCQVACSPIAAGRPHHDARSWPHHRRHGKYRPVHASLLSPYESRDETRQNVGDFVMHGLGGLMKLVSNQYGLRQSESFFWGSAGNPLANLTAYVGDKNVKVLSMERFEGVLDEAKCSHNSIQFTFNKETSFDLVQREWQWINDADDNYIVLVTENARCNAPDGDRTSRQPWHVKTASFDDSANTVTLTAVPRTWEDAFSHWHLKLDSQGLIHHPHRLSKRIGIDNQTFDLPLAATLPSTPLTFTDDDDEVTASIACSSCYTTGSLHFLVDITYWFPAQLTGTVTMTPNDVSAHITVDLTVEGTEEADHTIELWSWDADPFDILGISIGPAFKVDLVGTLESTAEVDISSGVVMSIPADAVAVLDFGDSSNNQFTDWVPIVTPNVSAPSLSSEISITATAALVLRPEFDLQIGFYGFSAGLALQAPVLSLTASAVSDTSGDICDVAGAVFGVDLDAAIGVELDGFAGFGAATDLPNEATIFSTAWDVFTTCLPVASGLPGGSISAIPSGSSSAASGYPSSSGYKSSARVASSSLAPGQYSSSALPASTYAPSESAWPSSQSVPASSYAAPSSSYAAPSSSYAVYAASSSSAAHSSVHIASSSSAWLG